VAERDKALEIINNWRSSHAYPLQVTKMTLLNRARKVDGNALIAQRLKRLSSIDAKLRRFADMRLSRMHDIGGCRAVLRSAGDVDALVRVYEESAAKNPNARSELVRKYDYVGQPKTDGYRSVHLVYKYRSLATRHAVYNGLRMEIQIRSKLQHAWATAVETVSTFTGQALKSNVGDESWKRFFVLMGSAIASREKRPVVPGTPAGSQLIAELRALAQELQIETVLRGWGKTVQVLAEQTTDAYAFLVILNPITRSVEVKGFRSTEMTQATEEYLSVETGRPEVQAVLVSVDSLAALRKAYPNYYLDTDAFIGIVRTAIGEGERVTTP
jgi:hypothetical protein